MGDQRTTVQQIESSSHTYFDCCQSSIVLGACAFHLRSLSVSREACVFPLTGVIGHAPLQPNAVNDENNLV